MGTAAPVLLGLRDAPVPPGSCLGVASKLGGAPKQECLFATMDWCKGADDWGGGDDMASSDDAAGHSPDLPTLSDPLPREEDCASQLRSLSLHDVPGISYPLHSSNPAGEEGAMPSLVPVFQPYYISVAEEEDYLGYDSDTNHAYELLKEYQQMEGVDLQQLMSESYATGGGGEKYEKSEAEKRDQVFHKFMKRISACQEQILRYSWGGQPLFVTCPSSDIKTAAPPCDNCKSKRIFEFQLMPALVSMLKTRAEDVSVEFGTVIVYTCEKSCWPADHPTPLEEFLFVQEDPDQQLFK
ncbi:hypothetical protein lerEdw1_001117 [Lerista edwardsae]|nr:hypothetical protein lerEdw1_001117 [Lerista edwardsae]